MAIVLGLALALSVREGAAAPLRVVTSFLPAYCFASNIAGSAAEVENLLPGTVSPHDYQLSPGDLRKLASADLIVVNGLGLESFLQRAIENTSEQTAQKIIRLSTGLEAELIEEAGRPHFGKSGQEHSHNPHIWLNPRLAMQSVTNLLREFERLDPKNAAVFRANAAAYLERLKVLDEELAKSLAPVREVAFVTYHSAFPYFVRRYGLKLVGVVEQVPEVPPSPRELSRLLATMRREQVKALFGEPGGETRLAHQIARDASVRFAELDPLETGTLSPDAYEEGMRRNLRTLRVTLAE